KTAQQFSHRHVELLGFKIRPVRVVGSAELGEKGLNKPTFDRSDVLTGSYSLYPGRPLNGASGFDQNAISLKDHKIMKRGSRIADDSNVEPFEIVPQTKVDIRHKFATQVDIEAIVKVIAKSSNSSARFGARLQYLNWYASVFELGGRSQPSQTCTNYDNWIV